MTIAVLAPNPFATFATSSGARYAADAYGVIANVLLNDIRDLVSSGCALIGYSGAGGNLVLTGVQFLIETAAVGITAGTTRTQGGATILTKEVNRVDTSTAPAVGTTLGDGVLLPASVAGLDVTVINNSSNVLQVYGAGADLINGLASIPLPPNSADKFICAGAGAWHAEAGVGYSGGLNTVLTANGVTAAGTTQAGATQLGADINRILTSTNSVAPFNGVKLPASALGLDVFIINHTGLPIQVFGAGTDTIDDVATATGVTQMNGSMALYSCASLGQWYAEGLGTGFAGGLQTIAYQDSISAAGTTQATATPLNASINNVTTVGAGAGVNLPPSAAGLSIIVQNSSLLPLLVYVSQGTAHTINGIAAGNGISLLPGTVANFNCTTVGAWIVQPGSTQSAAYNAASNASSFTASGPQITGGVSSVDIALTGALAAGSNLTLPPVATAVLAMHSPTIGSSYRLRVINQSSGAFAWTLVANTGWTLNGTLSIPQNTWREFIVTLTSLTTATLQSVATGTFS